MSITLVGTEKRRLFQLSSFCERTSIRKWKWLFFLLLNIQGHPKMVQYIIPMFHMKNILKHDLRARRGVRTKLNIGFVEVYFGAIK